MIVRFIAWLVPALTAILGTVLVDQQATGRLGNPNQCDGIGFGCTPSEFGAKLGVLAWLWSGVTGTYLLAALTRRARAVALTICLVGSLGTAALTSVRFRDAVIRYPVPARSQAEGRAVLEAALATLRAASTQPAGGTASWLPLLHALVREAAVPCRDVNGRDTGSVAYHWSARDIKRGPPSAFGPRLAGTDPQLAVGPPPVVVTELDAMAQALAHSGWYVEQNSLANGRTLAAQQAGQPPQEPADYVGLETTDRIDLSVTVAWAGAEVTMERGVGVRSACLRPGAG